VFTNAVFILAFFAKKLKREEERGKQQWNANYGTLSCV